MRSARFTDRKPKRPASTGSAFPPELHITWKPHRSCKISSRSLTILFNQRPSQQSPDFGTLLLGDRSQLSRTGQGRFTSGWPVRERTGQPTLRSSSFRRNWSDCSDYFLGSGCLFADWRDEDVKMSNVKANGISAARFPSSSVQPESESPWLCECHRVRSGYG